MSEPTIDINPKEFNTLQRREHMAVRDFETCYGIKNVEYAEMFGVTEGQISHDKRSEEYKDKFNYLNHSRVRRIDAKSMKLLECILDEGIRAYDNGDELERYDAKQLDAILNAESRDKDRGARTLQWFLEKSRRINDIAQEGEEEDIKAWLVKQMGKKTEDAERYQDRNQVLFIGELEDEIARLKAELEGKDAE